MTFPPLHRYIVGGKSAGDIRMSETSGSAPNGFLKKALDSVVLTVEKGANTQVKASDSVEKKGWLESVVVIT